MKVLAINSGRRNKNTYQILIQIKQILEKSNIDVEIINLHDYTIKHCIGCENCLIRDNCCLNDDVYKIKNMIMECDGLILASPVYLKSVSGVLKTFVDRTCSWYHRPVLFGKPILAVSTTKGSALKYTLEYLQDIGVQWGMMPSGKIGRSIININKQVDIKECKLFIDNLTKPKSKHIPPLKSILNFNIQKVLSNQLLELDTKYWNQMNWKNKNYYYPCRINIIKRAMGYCLYTFLNFIMKRK